MQSEETPEGIYCNATCIRVAIADRFVAVVAMYSVLGHTHPIGKHCQQVYHILP
jgi:hypothetical protein